MTEKTPESNAFEPGMAGTGGRSSAEAASDDLRERGGAFLGAVRATRMAMALTDPSLPGNPIVFANQSFLDLSGYELDEVLGRQPYFMNGPDTAPEEAARFREALEEDRDEVIETVQYRKDGSRFVAALFLSAFKDEEGRTLHHFLSWGDVTARVDAASDAAALRAAQAALRESEARQGVLLRLSDALRPLDDPAEIQAEAARVLGEDLGSVVHDVTAFKKAEERQGMLLAELQHRVRNILAMIRSIVRRTAETSATVQDYAQHLEGRIGALARTQAMLTREPGRGVDLQSIVESELLSIAAQTRQYSCLGPPVTLAPKAAEVLSLAIHELATNAIKYGAFARSGGHLEVSWSTRLRGGELWLTLHWIESGVADMGVPGREGFGMELITRRVPYELDGKGVIRPGADGIAAIIELPLEGGAGLLETSAANDP